MNAYTIIYKYNGRKYWQNMKAKNKKTLRRSWKRNGNPPLDSIEKLDDKIRRMNDEKPQYHHEFDRNPVYHSRA